jgi:cyclopropane fatty-acyl-phospholipid synthase-like methyltransferase
MTHMRLSDFEALYQRDPDPWGYESSDYERGKYDATIGACGTGPFAHALELGSSIGVLSARLSPLCHRLTTIDGSSTAVRVARERLVGLPVEVMLGEIPDAIGAGPFDLIVASEILYYLQPAALDETLARLRAAAVPGSPLVAVHWRPPGVERPFSAQEVHERLRSEDWLAPLTQTTADGYLLDVLEVR